MVKNHVWVAYKAFRNKLREFDLGDSLYSIWAYTRFLDFRKPFPTDINVDRSFFAADKKEVFLPPWELHTLAKECILHSSEVKRPNSLKNWNNLSNSINKLRAFDEATAKHYFNDENIMHELFRITHRQFPPQRGTSELRAARYFKIFSTSEVDDILKKECGFDAKTLHSIGTLFLGAYINSFIQKIPLEKEIGNLKSSDIESFLKLFSIDLELLKERIISSHEVDENFNYAYNPLVATPLIRMKFHQIDSIACPVPSLLFDQYTAGVYYSLIEHKKFGNVFGKAFENYVGEVIDVVNKKGKWRVLDDNNDNFDNTVDWIIEEDNFSLFIECKAKRMTLESKREISSRSAFNKDIETLIKNLIQAYKSVNRYLNNSYPNYPFKTKQKIKIMLLTLDDWYTFVLEGFGFKLKDKIRERMKESGLPEDFLERFPYIICSIDEFERMIQVSEKVGIGNLFDSKTAHDEHKTWAMGSYISKAYPEEYKEIKILFPEYFPIIESLAKTRD